MPNYKLTYFNGRGRGELIRLLLEVAGVKYEDVRIELEDWASLKQKFVDSALGQLPVLEVDGKPLTQHKAIGRYLAREFDLYGANSQEALDIDIVSELCDDLTTPLYILYDEIPPPEDKKKEVFQTYYGETAPAILGRLQKVLCQNKNGDGFFVGDHISLADIFFLIATDWVIREEYPDALDAFPKLKAANERIRGYGRLADYLKTRPVSIY